MADKRVGTDWVALSVLVALILGFGIWTNIQLGRMHSDLGEMRTEISKMRTELYNVGQRVARIEGMIEGPFPTGKHASPGSK